MSIANLFLLINLGCEMIYIIDQRLTAQDIAKDKSAQGENIIEFLHLHLNMIDYFLVIREVTSALLAPHFFQYICTTFSEELISIAQIRILLSDIACCSLMRLDHHSLDKLLDLMIMVFKWQMFLISNPDELLNITFRHLHGIGKLIPEQAKMILIDQANQFFFTQWNQLGEENRYGVVRRLNKFLSPFNIRISLLIRMKLQARDGAFVDKVAASSNDFFRYYLNNLGENLYEKIAHFPHCQVLESKPGAKKETNEIDCLFHQFNVDMSEASEEPPAQSSQGEPIRREVVETRNTLDELKKKCRFDLPEEAPPEYDNFEELLSMLGENSS